MAYSSRVSGIFAKTFEFNTCLFAYSSMLKPYNCYYKCPLDVTAPNLYLAWIWSTSVHHLARVHHNAVVTAIVLRQSSSNIHKIRIQMCTCAIITSMGFQSKGFRKLPSIETRRIQPTNPGFTRCIKLLNCMKDTSTPDERKHTLANKFQTKN